MRRGPLLLLAACSHNDPTPPTARLATATISIEDGTLPNPLGGPDLTLAFVRMTADPCLPFAASLGGRFRGLAMPGVTFGGPSPDGLVCNPAELRMQLTGAENAGDPVVEVFDDADTVTMTLPLDAIDTRSISGTFDLCGGQDAELAWSHPEDLSTLLGQAGDIAFRETCGAASCPGAGEFAAITNGTVVKFPVPAGTPLGYGGTGELTIHIAGARKEKQVTCADAALCVYHLAHPAVHVATLDASTCP